MVEEKKRRMQMPKKGRWTFGFWRLKRSSAGQWGAAGLAGWSGRACRASVERCGAGVCAGSLFVGSDWMHFEHGGRVVVNKELLGVNRDGHVRTSRLA